MKSTKLLAALVPLALTVAAFGVSSTASATVICQAPGYSKECPAQYIYNPSKIEPRANSLTLSANGESVTCGSSTMTIEGFGTNPGKSLPLKGTATFGAFPCTSFPSGLGFCGSAEFGGRPYKAELTEGVGGKGTLAITEAEKSTIRQPRIIFSGCPPFNQQCIYGKGSFHLEWNGSELPSAVRWNEELPLISGPTGCNATIKLEAVYYLDAVRGENFTATSPHLEFLGEKEKWADCKATASWAGSPSSTLSIGTSECGEWPANYCEAAMAKGSPYSTRYSVNGTGDTVMTVLNAEFELSECGFGAVCHFQAAELPLVDHIVEHSNQWAIEKVPFLLKSGFGCQKEVKLNGTFTSTSPVYAISPIP